MGAKHQTPEYHRNARIIRARVNTAHRTGQHVACWRCGGPITRGTPFDVGHLPGAIASRLNELAPEHRHRTGHCPGNRAAGGREGAAITNARHAPTTPSNPETTRTWPI